MRRVRRSVDRAGRGAWVSGRVGKGTSEALSMKRRSDEGHVDLRYWLMFQRGTWRKRRNWNRVRWHLYSRGRRRRLDGPVQAPKPRDSDLRRGRRR